MNSILASSSPRRIAQFSYYRSDLKFIPLRGNLDTRINKLKTKKFTATILALAGLKRLKLMKYIAEIIPTSICLPAVAQGILGIECLKNNKELIDFLAPLNHKITYMKFLAERSFLKTLAGNCKSPIAGYSTIKDKKLYIEGLVANFSGSKLLKSKISGNYLNPVILGRQLAQKLIQKGAKSLI